MEEYRIIKALSGFYYVQTEDGVVECRARGPFPAAGPVAPRRRFRPYHQTGGQGCSGGASASEKTRLSARRLPISIDQLVVLASCAIPVTEPFLIDRVLAIAQLQNVPALVVVNKDDLAPAQPLAEIYRRAGVPVLVTKRGNRRGGIEALREALAGKLSCLTGNSGVGKSSSEPRLPAASAARRRGFGKSFRPRPPYHAPH